MKISTQMQVGNVVYKMDFDEKNEMDTFHKAIVISNPPRYCHCCKNTESFKLDSNKDKEGNTYINVVCLKSPCFAKAKLGQYKTGGYFWHKFEQYKKPESTGNSGKNEEEVTWNG